MLNPTGCQIQCKISYFASLFLPHPNPSHPLQTAYSYFNFQNENFLSLSFSILVVNKTLVDLKFEICFFHQKFFPKPSIYKYQVTRDNYNYKSSLFNSKMNLRILIANFLFVLVNTFLNDIYCYKVDLIAAINTVYVHGLN